MEFPGSKLAYSFDLAVRATRLAALQRSCRAGRTRRARRARDRDIVEAGLGTFSVYELPLDRGLVPLRGGLAAR